MSEAQRRGRDPQKGRGEMQRESRGEAPRERCTHREKKEARQEGGRGTDR